MSVYYGTKETIITNVYNVLVSLYNSQTVDRQYVEPGNYGYPSIYINDTSQTRKRILKDVVLIEWTINLVLFVYDEGSTLSTTINTELDRVCDKLKDDPTRGGLAYNTEIERIDLEFEKPHAVALFTIKVIYLGQK